MSAKRFDISTMVRAAAQAVLEAKPSIRHVLVIALDDGDEGIVSESYVASRGSGSAVDQIEATHHFMTALCAEVCKVKR